MNAPAPHATAQPTARPPSAPRQFINFAFYKLDPAWRRLPEAERQAGQKEAAAALSPFSSSVITIAYSCLGFRPDVDFFLWRISYNLEDFENMSAALARTRLGAHLLTPHGYLAQSKRSTYVDKINPEHEGQRTKIQPGRYKYIFIYPFVKTREWYLLPLAERQVMMDEHIRVGNQFPTVKLNTTYSFGLDDQDFVVAFESDQPSDFLDLVMALRETQSSRYTVRDTPIFTGVRRGIEDVLTLVG
ncbi:MAG: chlorite dismutase family protein [Elusimicrobia bacterium]|nr:chlorite dismutase family protein [Elusimicrobiota bacterium]MBP9128512.1 chlorite dismutase family protein [Elusimicrobiota bacterium]MBP9699354.1 chlorite dismutase family protein [Elusimicrobiota bacterium]